jgi:3-oxoacyl-[acyl-carrier-protein] synthase II
MLSEVLIRGLGLVTPLGWGREASWRRILAGESATRIVDCAFPEIAHINGDIPAEYLRTKTVGAPLLEPYPLLPISLESNLTRSQRALLHAVNEAWLDAELDLADIPRERIGCVVGSSKGDWDLLSPIWQSAQSPHAMNSEMASAQSTFAGMAGWPHTFGSLVAQKYDLRGPLYTPVAACATGLLALMRGVDLIRHGDCDAVVVGSVDCSLHPLQVASFRRLGVLNEDFAHPESALKPFNQHRQGFAIGEGAAAVILTSASFAKAAHPSYARWLSHFQCAEISDAVRIENDSASLHYLVNKTLALANYTPLDIDVINLHGTGTERNDLAESSVVASIFQQNRHYICHSLKGGIGHLLGAAGLVEVALGAMSLKHQMVPATCHCHTIDPQIKIPLVTAHAHSRKIESVLKLSLGFGGHLSAGLMSRAD